MRPTSHRRLPSRIPAIVFGLRRTRIRGGIVVRNKSSSVIRGPVYVVLIGEPTHFGYPYDSLLLGSQPITTCVTPLGDYLLPISGDLMPGASAGYATAWMTQSSLGRISYSVKVISGTPSH